MAAFKSYIFISWFPFTCADFRAQPQTSYFAYFGFICQPCQHVILNLRPSFLNQRRNCCEKTPFNNPRSCIRSISVNPNSICLYSIIYKVIRLVNNIPRFYNLYCSRWADPSHNKSLLCVWRHFWHIYGFALKTEILESLSSIPFMYMLCSAKCLNTLTQICFLQVRSSPDSEKGALFAYFENKSKFLNPCQRLDGKSLSTSNLNVRLYKETRFERLRAAKSRSGLK